MAGGAAACMGGYMAGLGDAAVAGFTCGVVLGGEEIWVSVPVVLLVG